MHNVRGTRVVEFNAPSSSLSHYVLLPIIRSRTQLLLYLDVNSMKYFFPILFPTYRCTCRFKTPPSPRSKIGVNAGGHVAHFLQLYRKNKYGDFHTVEPRYSKGQETGKNLFPITRFRYIEVLFHVFHYCWGKQNRSLYRSSSDVEVPLYFSSWFQ